MTSVGTGAFILGAAGLWKGRRATTHWGYAELMPLIGATHEKRRVVRDGNLITAGGVTSGVDFGLAMVAEIAGRRGPSRSTATRAQKQLISRREIVARRHHKFVKSSSAIPIKRAFVQWMSSTELDEKCIVAAAQATWHPLPGC